MGPTIIVIVLLAMPVAVMMTGAVVAALLGYLNQKDVEEKFAGTEYRDLA